MAGETLEGVFVLSITACVVRRNGVVEINRKDASHMLFGISVEFKIS